MAKKYICFKQNINNLSDTFSQISKTQILYFYISKILMLVYFSIAVNLIFFGLSTNEKREINKNLSIVSLKVNKTGKTKIFYSGIFRNDTYFPDVVQINGINQTLITFEYDITSSNDDVKLIWENNFL